MRDRFCQIICLCIFAMLQTAVGKAQNTMPIALQASAGERFLAVESLDEINDGDLCVIGAVSAKGEFHLMRTQKEESVSGEKLGGLLIAPQPDADLQTADESVVWRIETDGTGQISFSTPDGEKHLFTPKKSGTDLTLHATKTTMWSANANANGSFTLTHSEETKRVLSISSLTNAYFGNFTKGGCDSYELYIFCKATADAPPTNGALFAITADRYMAVSQNEATLSATDISHRIAFDGSIAPEENSGEWTCRHVDQETFQLENADGLYLDYNLTAAAQPASWQIIHGKITTAEAEDARRILCFDTDTRRFLLAKEQEMPSAALAAALSSIGDAPDSTLTNGIKRLTGTWNAQKLAAVDWTAADALDLTDAVWAKSAEDFTARPEDRHSFIYIREAHATFAPESWHNLVGSDGNAYRLLREASLTDKKPLRIPTAFSADDEQMTYVREMHTDGGWETIILPFEAEVPGDCHAERLKEYANGTLNFASITTIPANTPVIIRYTGDDTSDTHTGITFRSVGGTVSTDTDNESILQGTYQPFTVDTEEGNIYLLRADGEAFVKATKGSHLSPFRAAIHLETAKQTLPLMHNGVSGISSAMQAPSSADIFTPDGRKIEKTHSSDILNQLPRGIYIVNGKKIIK